MNGIKAPCELKKCPWCKKEPNVVKIILSYTNGYFISCKNEKCKVQPKSRTFYDILSEEKDPELYIKKACDAWNSLE